jgi:hypothetical protein
VHFPDEHQDEDELDDNGRETEQARRPLLLPIDPF